MNTAMIMSRRQPHWINSLALLFTALTLTGCASHASSGENDHLIPQQGLTVQQIYHQAGQGGEGNTMGDEWSGEGDTSLETARQRVLPAAYPTTTQSSPFVDTKTQFALMENPSIPIYIYPHLVNMGTDEVPVDGYATAFFLYTKNHYALPWERA